MNRIITLLAVLCTLLSTHSTLLLAEDGSRLWLRYDTLNTCRVDGPECMAAQVLRTFCPQPRATLRINAAMAADDGYRISGTTVESSSEVGLLYGALAMLRGEQGESHPYFRYRILNHWDNPDGSIERGYAGRSIFWSLTPDPSPKEKGIDSFSADVSDNGNNQSPLLGRGVGSEALIQQYALANASVGINGTVLNNVNASPKMLTRAYLNKVKEYADLLRPYGLRVYLSVNFGSPKALGEVHTADPLNPRVKAWWKKKAAEIYKLIPDFGGFLVKANSEGQPGPFDYGRSHADGANMLADALQPFGGVVIWRSFVYGAKHKGEDRVKQAVSEFAELDGQFRDNVILQSKNGPLDFQPREPYAPIFDQMTHTQQMAELQITQEYLGQSRQLVFLAPMWKEFFSFVAPQKLVGIAGVANIGLDRNWCGHHFAQANWYAFGRLAWQPSLSSKAIAEEWLRQTWSLSDDSASEALVSMMLRSREACVDYMMPLGLHHIFRFDHHMGPEPGGFKANYPIEWCPVYYHRATADSIGFNRSTTGSGATQQYREPYRTLYDNVNTCPERYLLWFHRVPWTRRLNSGRTLREEMLWCYNRGVAEVEDFIKTWQRLRNVVDEQRWQEVNERLGWQLDDAREWRDVCAEYFKLAGNAQEAKAQ